MAQERLTLEGEEAGSLLACHHLQRYELAARLCAGLRVADVCCGTGYGTAMLAATASEVVGVDIDAATVADAARRHEGLRFVVADAVAWLLGEAAGVEAVVMFEGLEHLDEPELAVRALERLRAAGVRVVVSVPNGRTFQEENEFHRTEYDERGALELAERLGGAVLHQYLAEGSIVLGAGPGELSSSVHLLERAEGEYANHFLVVAGFPAEALEGEHARGNVALAPYHNRYMRALEGANRELWRTNQRIARGHWGTYDAAAASLLKRVQRAEAAAAEAERQAQEAERQAQEAERQAQEAELRARHAEERFALERDIAQRNHDMYEQMVRWYDAPRYRAVDALRNGLLRVPGLRQAAVASWRAITRRRAR